MKLALWDDRPAGSRGDQLAWRRPFVVVHPLAQVLFTLPARTGTGRLVPIGQQHEGGVIAIRPDDPVRFLVQPLIERFAVPDRGASVGPRSAFHLEVEPQFIRGRKGCLRRAPRMEPNMIQSELLAACDDALPLCDVGGRVAGQRKDAALERTAEGDALSIEQEMAPRGLKLPHAKRHAALVDGSALRVRVYGHLDSAEVWCVFIPEFHVRPQCHRDRM